MNAKQAKRLRKMLRTVAAQQTVDGKPVTDCAYQENTKNRKVIEVAKGQGAEETKEVTNADGTVTVVPNTETVTIAVGTVTVVPNTIKGLYKRLKKAHAKAGNKMFRGKRLVEAV